jgi:hypothetical protein
MNLVSMSAALFSRRSCLLLRVVGMRLPILIARVPPVPAPELLSFGAVGEVGLSESSGLVLWYGKSRHGAQTHVAALREAAGTVLDISQEEPLTLVTPYSCNWIFCYWLRLPFSTLPCCLPFRQTTGVFPPFRRKDSFHESRC